MNNFKKLFACLGVMTACLVGFSPVAYAAVAGHVQFVNGNVLITNSAGQAHQAQKGEAVNEGDIMTSAPNSSAQIKMQDGGFVAMRPDTKLKFDQFVFHGKQDGSEKSFFSLFKGGFRAVTGLIGQINKPNYKITTPAATIGIRGTDHETFLITPDSQMVQIAPVGAYSKVNVGETTLTTNRGVINVLPNQMGFAGGMDQAPKIQPLNTNIFTVAPAPSVAKVEKKEEKKEDKKEQAGSKQGEKSATSEKKEEKQEDTATAPAQASAEQAASPGSGEASDTAAGGSQGASGGTPAETVVAVYQETAPPIRTSVAVDTIAPRAALIQSPVASVTAPPAVPAMLIIAPQPVIAQPIIITTAAGIALNTATGTAITVTGQQVVPNAPTLATCTAAPATAGCAAVLPTLATCTATPATAGCTAVLPTLATCTAAPATAGCAAVLPTLATCTATPATAGCTAVLPTLATCTATPATAGCTAVLPTLATCTATPATAGCTAVLPTLATCTATPATVGCTAVLPTLATCTATPATAGCTAVLPTLATCTATPATAGCTAVLPTLATCTAAPATAGCTAVLPTLATCTAAPATAGCTAVLNPPIVVQAYVQTDVALEISVSNNTNGGYVNYYGGNSMTAAANVAPQANPPSFGWNYGCLNCGNSSIQLPGATGAINGNATSFATTGIQFGRWTNAPSISQSSTYMFAPGQNNAGNSSSSWAFAPEGYLDTPTKLSAATGAGTGAVMGVFNYALNGAALAPKDQNGTAGILNSLTLAANFTTQTVTAALSVSLGATTWTASSATPMSMGGGNGTAAGFGGALTVVSSNMQVSTSGSLSGAFTGQNYAGAIVDYSIWESPLAGGVTTTNISGVAAMTRNGVTVNGVTNAIIANGTAAPTGKFVVAEGGGYMWNLQTTNTATATAGVLTSYASSGVGYTSTNTITCTSCTGQAAPDTATGIQYGTWNTGSRTYSYNSPFGGQFHWIKGPGLDPVYLPEVLTGTMTYALDGGTTPTNQNGVAGILGSASLTVNFTTQTVNIALGLTGVNGHNWTASSTGTPLNWTSYSKNGFWISNGAVTGGLNVMMDGVTAGTGYISGQLTGSGLNGAIFQYQLNAPLAASTVPGIFSATTDTVTMQAPSVVVTGPIGTGQPVSIAFPAGVNATLAPFAATALNVTLTAGVPTSATVSGGVTGTVPLTANINTPGSYNGIEPVSGYFVSVDTLGHKVTNSGSAGGLKYSNFGEWRMRPNVVGLAPANLTGTFTIGEFAGGMLPTAAASMPVSNVINATYSGSMVGVAQNSANNTPYSLDNGWMSLSANFTTGALTGSVSNIQVSDKNTGVLAGYFNDLSLTATVTTNAFSGSVAANAAPVGTTASPVNVPVGTAGTTSGHFYGPNANELTGIWQLASGTIKAAGSFGVANGTSGMATTESVNGVVALVTATPANVATSYRIVGISGYDPAATWNGGMVWDGGAVNTTRVTTDVAGNLTAFDSGFGHGGTNNLNSVTLGIGTAVATGLGTDPVSGISWGRWAGGSINITDRTTGAAKPGSNATSSMHWLASPSMTAPVALPTTGTYNYVLAGGTAPTDNLGNVGVLNSATLTANFTAQTVNVGVNVGINAGVAGAGGATTLNASAANVPIQQRQGFSTSTTGIYSGAPQSLTATCAGAGCVAGVAVQAHINGGFTGPTGAGAGMMYGFQNGSNVVNGVAAFHR